jgi:hypothetical protein
VSTLLSFRSRHFFSPDWGSQTDHPRRYLRLCGESLSVRKSALLDADRVCQELVGAEKECCSTQHNEYAHKIFREEGQRNGLYWKVSDSKTHSPIGALVASAVTEGHAKSQDGAPIPCRGYYYRILMRPGWSRRREKLHRKQQKDTGFRFHGLSGGIQIVWRNDIHH